MKNRDIYWRRCNVQETLYIEQWQLSPLQSRHLGTSHSSPDCHQLPHHIFLNLSDNLKSLPFQRWFQVWEKSSHMEPNLGCRGAESPGWFDVLSETAVDMVSEWVLCWSCQSPGSHSCSLWIIQVVPMEECPNLTQNLMQIRCSTHSTILNATATQYTCSLKVVSTTLAG